MKHLSLMCAGMALCMLMNIDGGSGGGAAGVTTVDDGADEPSSGGGSEANVNVEHADQIVGGEVAENTDDEPTQGDEEAEAAHDAGEAAADVENGSED